MVTTFGAMTVRGQADPLAKTGHTFVSVISVRPAIGMELILVDGVTYAKIGGMSGVPDDWMRFESNTLSGTHLDVLPKHDPAGASQLIAGLVTVERDGERHFRGTLDLTKSPTSGAYTMKGMDTQAKAKSVPFTAMVDVQGRLTLLDIVRRHDATKAYGAILSII